MSETEKDIANIEAWAEIIRDMLWHVPSDKRADLLALATKNEEIEAKERATTNGGFTFMTLSDDWKNKPGFRHCNAIARLKSLLVQIFVRDITNDHSAKDAAKILFAQHRYGQGSRLLGDYIDDIPRTLRSV